MSLVQNEELVALMTRPDLQAVGAVFVDPRRPGTTATLWQLVGRSDPRELEAHRRETGQVPGAFVYVFAHSVAVHVNHEWRDVVWLQTYLVDLTRQIAMAESFAAFIAALEFPSAN